MTENITSGIGAWDELLRCSGETAGTYKSFEHRCKAINMACDANGTQLCMALDSRTKHMPGEQILSFAIARQLLRVWNSRSRSAFVWERIALVVRNRRLFEKIVTDAIDFFYLCLPKHNNGIKMKKTESEIELFVSRKGQRDSRSKWRIKIEFYNYREEQDTRCRPANVFILQHMADMQETDAEREKFVRLLGLFVNQDRASILWVMTTWGYDAEMTCEQFVASINNTIDYYQVPQDIMTPEIWLAEMIWGSRGPLTPIVDSVSVSIEQPITTE